MDIELRSKFDIFKGTYKEMKKNFFYDGKRLNVIKAFESVSNNREFDADRVKEIRKYLYKSKFDLFTLRYGKILSTFICDSDNYKDVYKTSKNIYEHLTAVGFNKNKITLALSLMLTRNFNGDKLNKMVEKTVQIKGMLKLKGEEYYILPALSKSEANDTENELYNIKTAILNVESYTDSMAELLALSLMISDEDVNTKVENAFSLVCNVKEEIGKITEKSLVFIGLASLIVEDHEVFSKELKAICSLFDENAKRIFNKENKVLAALSILIIRYIEEAKSGVTHSRVCNDALRIIEDYVICLMYFN